MNVYESSSSTGASGMGRGLRKGDRPKPKCSGKQNRAIVAGSVVREGRHRVRQKEER